MSRSVDLLSVSHSRASPKIPENKINISFSLAPTNSSTRKHSQFMRSEDENASEDFNEQTEY